MKLEELVGRVCVSRYALWVPLPAIEWRAHVAPGEPFLVLKAQHGRTPFNSNVDFILEVLCEQRTVTVGFNTHRLEDVLKVLA